jgi:hypothetical protein
VQAWLATWIAHHDEVDAESVPAHVQRELSAYLECGILAHGFARSRCPDCTAEFLVAFSCKPVLSLSKGTAASARRAQPSAWRRRRRIWSIR